MKKCDWNCLGLHLIASPHISHEKDPVGETEMHSDTKMACLRMQIGFGERDFAFRVHAAHIWHDCGSIVSSLWVIHNQMQIRQLQNHNDGLPMHDTLSQQLRNILDVSLPLHRTDNIIKHLQERCAVWSHFSVLSCCLKMNVANKHLTLPGYRYVYCHRKTLVTSQCTTQQQFKLNSLMGYIF